MSMWRRKDTTWKKIDSMVVKDGKTRKKYFMGILSH
jgi:hypothetical protein